MPRRARPASVIAALVAVVAGGCSAISGLNGFRFDGGDATSSGGASGGGGASANTGGSSATGGGSVSSTGAGGGGCDTPADCPAPKVCFGATCKNHKCGSSVLPENTPCNGPGTAMMVCDNGMCVGCVDNTECTPPKTCGGGGVANACGCSLGLTCAMLDKTCGSVDDGCGNMIDCDDNKRDGSETDVDCGGPAASCATRCPNGKRCTAASDCIASSPCEQGYCCSSVCNAVCFSCGLNGARGTCTALPEGEQQAGRCDDTDGGCGGLCACGAGGVCRLQSGQMCDLPSQCASGNCTGGACE